MIFFIFADSSLASNSYSGVETERARYIRGSAANTAASYYNTHRNSIYVTPYRYNSLDYKRIRKMESDTKDYSARCTDIGSASFCQ